MNIKKNIPNALTCGNLLCGCLAIVSAFNGDLIWSAYLVGIAAVLDFFDGFVARLLKVHSEIGKQLDSLADMVTFGVVPGVIMFHLMQISLGLISHFPRNDFATSIVPGWHTTIYPTYTYLLPFSAFLITIFSALRLAKFNIDTRQTDSFIGVPTPANTILIASFPLILGLNTINYNLLSSVLDQTSEGIAVSLKIAGKGRHLEYDIILNIWFLLGMTILMSYLLVAELPLFALKFKHFNWKGNEIRFVFLGLSAALLILFQFTGIPFIIFLYIILSVINNIGKKKKEQDYDLIAKK